MRVFVAWDFRDHLARQLLTACHAYITDPIDWRIPGITIEPNGRIGEEVVGHEIRSADAVIALVDQANGNVAFEAGFALGAGKPLKLAALRGKPSWLKEAPLAGAYVEVVHEWSAVAPLLASTGWTIPRPAAQSGTGASYVLCPGGPDGGGLRTWMERSGYPLELAPVCGHKLGELTTALGKASRVLWILCGGHNQQEGRDGVANAAHAIAAGVAEGCGIPLAVLRSQTIEPLVDVAHLEVVFDSLDHFKRALQSRLALGAVSADPGTQQTLGVTVPVPRGLNAHALVTELSRVFSRVADIRKLADTAEVDLPDTVIPEQLWADVLRQLHNAQHDIAWLLRTGLLAAPDSIVFKRLLPEPPNNTSAHQNDESD